MRTGRDSGPARLTVAVRFGLDIASVSRRPEATGRQTSAPNHSLEVRFRFGLVSSKDEPHTVECARTSFINQAGPESEGIGSAVPMMLLAADGEVTADGGTRQVSQLLDPGSWGNSNLPATLERRVADITGAENDRRVGPAFIPEGSPDVRLEVKPVSKRRELN